MSEAHWSTVHGEKSAQEVSWFQIEPGTSLRLLGYLDIAPGASIIDVGCGKAGLAHALADAGFNVTGLDLAREAISAGQVEHPNVHWVQGNVLDLDAAARYDLWHDRAVLHFLHGADRELYRDVMTRATKPSAHAIIGGFAPDGPSQCSNLPVHRADAAEMAQLFEADWEMVHNELESHTTPWGAIQSFQWIVVKRR